MDILEFEERLKAVEDRICCNVIFYTTLPSTGKTRVLYIDEASGDQFIWNGSAFIQINQ